MKLSIDRQKFAPVYALAAGLAPTRHQYPVLQNVLLLASFDTIRLHATDGETSLRLRVEQGAAQPGSVLLPPLFGQILRECSAEEVTLRLEDSTLVVEAGPAAFELATEDASLFPLSSHERPDDDFVTVNSSALQSVIKRTSFACDGDSSRYALGGVKLEFGFGEMHAVGTDGKRLSYAHCPATGTLDGPIVPADALTLAAKCLPAGVVAIWQDQQRLVVQSENVTLSTVLLEGRFPKWRDVLRPASQPIDVQAGPFHAAMRQASLATDKEGSVGVDFTLVDGRCDMKAASQRGQARSSCVVPDRPPVSITLDPRLVADFVKQLPPESTFAWDVADDKTAALFSVDGWQYVVMPLSRDER